MVNDVTLSMETHVAFKTYLDDYSNMHLGIELTVTVLMNGVCPTCKSSELNLPLEMLKCIELYKWLYSTKYHHHKLTWLYILGINCKIIGMFDSKPLEITVSINQGFMFLLFNGSERSTYVDIVSQFNMWEEDVLILMHSIVCGKYKIILKEPVTQTIAETNHFELNACFTWK